ncbi:hypothetical protein AMECASPLE_000037 [Ameca splendens]|uniref:Uncharacterized protein n=1 Tax=Ameca splendens TaxID=208324 RepID=A0ABV1A4Z5_9TELE
MQPAAEAVHAEVLGLCSSTLLQPEMSFNSWVWRDPRGFLTPFRFPVLKADRAMFGRLVGAAGDQLMTPGQGLCCSDFLAKDMKSGVCLTVVFCFFWYLSMLLAFCPEVKESFCKSVNKLLSC